MENFLYYTPTKVYFGKDTHLQVGEIIKSYGYDTIMLQYGKNSIKKSGLYDAVMDSLNKNGIKVVEMGGVEPNPKLSFVREAVKVARDNKVQMILAVGGGSVIDSSKYTALGAVNDCDVWDFPTGKATPEKCLPVACILTIAAAGSEMSNSAVVTNMDINMKRGYGNDIMRCQFAICNPELTYTLGKYQTACGIVDIMAHTMERYFTLFDPTELTDRVAEGILKSVINAAKVLTENPQDYDARATIMWASSISHNGLTGCGRSNFLAVHQIEHALSGEYDEIAHGAGLAVLFPAWARYAYKENISRFAQFAKRVWDVVEDDDEKAAIEGINRMSAFFEFIGMPTKLRDFNVDESCFDRLAELCTFGGKRTIPTYIELDQEKIKDILKICL